MNQISANIDTFAAQLSAGASSTATKLLKVLADVGQNAKTTVFIPANNFISNNILTFVNSVSVGAFQGTWTGTMSYNVSGHFYSDPITIKFTSGASVKVGSLNLKFANGTMTYVYRYLNPDGTTRGTTTLTSYISWTLWGTTLVNGTMKAHVPGGAYGTANFMWNLDRATQTISGPWVEGANSTISAQKVA